MGLQEKNRTLAVSCAELRGLHSESSGRAARLRGELDDITVQCQSQADELLQAREACKGHLDALSRAEAKVKDLVDLATNVISQATWQGKVNGMRAAIEGSLTVKDLEEEEAQLKNFFPLLLTSAS